MENETKNNSAVDKMANTTPNADNFLGGNYLRKEDLTEPRNVTVTDVWSEKILGSNRPKLIIGFKEIEKPLILNKTNIKRLVAIFGTADTAQWRGEVFLYVEKSVEYGGRIVGGLRVHRPRTVNGHAVETNKTETHGGVDIGF